MSTFVVEVPIELKSESNMREHWRVKAIRKKAQRTAVALCWRSQVRSPVQHEGMFQVELTRFCPARSRMRDDDNVVSAFKSVRDEVAKCLGRDDSTKGGILWRYEQHAHQKHWITIRVTLVSDPSS